METYEFAKVALFVISKEIEGGNIERMKKDIDKGNFEDLIAFTRKYNGVLSQEMSNANKIFTDEAKKEGKSLKEKARDHLIEINQSARRRSAEGCNAGLEGLKKDLVDFTQLAQVEPPS